MLIRASHIPEILIIEPDVFGDERGFFMEAWHAKKYAENGLNIAFVQDNHSKSTRNVLRGLHYQLEEPQGKLVRVVSGAVFDVAVDIRKRSPTFGQWVSVELSEENHKQVYIPPGFAHGFCVLSDSADVIYKCTSYYAPDDEHGILWNDPQIDIRWPGKDFLVSEKDASNELLCDMQDYLPAYKGSA